jgi:hypothetical protein
LPAGITTIAAIIITTITTTTGSFATSSGTSLPGITTIITTTIIDEGEAHGGMNAARRDGLADGDAKGGSFRRVSAGNGPPIRLSSRRTT